MAAPIPGESSVVDLLGGWLADDPPPAGRLARFLPTSGTLPGFPGRSRQARPLMTLVALLRSHRSLEMSTATDLSTFQMQCT